MCMLKFSKRSKLRRVKMAKFQIANFKIFLIVEIFCQVHGQICSRSQLPSGHKCDNKEHVFFSHKNKISKYCGITNEDLRNKPKLTGGRDAQPGEIPWMVSIVHSRRHQCGGVIIDNRHVVTAAHCIILKHPYPEHGLKPSEITVVAGTVHRYDPNGRDPRAHVFEVINVATHGLYIQEAFNEYGAFHGFDIALLTVANPIMFSSEMLPVCVGSYDLPLGFSNLAPLTLSGFGKDKYEYHELLRTSNNLELYPTDNCKNDLEEHQQIKDGQICIVPKLTGFYSKMEGTVACDGDSGGPLTQDYEDQTYLLGLVSWGPDSCEEDGNARVPDIYTDIRYYQSWIEEECSDWITNEDGSTTGDDLDSDSLEALAPNCGGSMCFRALDGACTFIDSTFVRCNDEITCTIEDNAPFITNGELSTFVAPTAGLSKRRSAFGRRKRCIRWAYEKSRRKWRCLVQKVEDSALRQRRNSEDSMPEDNTLICPVLSCQTNSPILGQWTSILEVPCKNKPFDLEKCDRESGEQCVEVRFCPSLRDLVLASEHVEDGTKAQFALLKAINSSIGLLTSCGMNRVCCRTKSVAATAIYFSFITDHVLISNQCNPSPCGENGSCRVVRGQPDCECKVGFSGSPPNCELNHQGCRLDLECEQDEVCDLTTQHCVSMCKNSSCGLGAECHQTSGSLSCLCPKGLVGDPFVACSKEKLTKLLVTTGLNVLSGIQLNHSEVVDLETGQTCHVDHYPGGGFYGAIGVLINNTPVVCGGCSAIHCAIVSKNCFALNHDGTWTKHEGFNAGRGAASILGNDKDHIMIFGGLGKDKRLNSIEEWTPETRKWRLKSAPSYAKPVGLFGHCAVSLNETHTMLIGGRRSNSMRYSGMTHIYDKTQNSWSYGPVLRIGRRYAICGLVSTNSAGQRTVVVAGGWNGEVTLKSTELLNLDDRRPKRWRRGPQIPITLTNAASVQNASGKLLAVAGDESAVDYTGGEQKAIYQLSSPRGPWRKLKYELRLARSAHVAMLIPDAFATDCST